MNTRHGLQLIHVCVRLISGCFVAETEDGMVICDCTKGREDGRMEAKHIGCESNYENVKAIIEFCEG